MSTSGRDKGFAFERRIARDLSLWVSKGADPYVFARRQASGGAQRDKAGLSGSTGDIFADKEAGRWLTDMFSLELKFYEDLKPALWRMIAGERTLLHKFIRQAETDARAASKRWMLIVRTNRFPTLIFTDHAGFGAVIPANSRIGVEVSVIPFEHLLAHDADGIRKRLSKHQPKT